MEAIWTCSACGEEILKLFASYELSKWIHDRVRHPGLADVLVYAGTLAIGLLVANGSPSKSSSKPRR
jgi:hypothetical protein